jgi:hypothetical protein
MLPDARSEGPGSNRRSFLSQMLRTVAVGLGVAAVGGPLAGAASARRANASPSRSTTCAVYCYPQTCPGGCPPDCNIFRCVSACGDPDSYSCMNHDCSGFCLSTSIC